MIDFTVYRFIHFLGIIMIFVSLGRRHGARLQRRRQGRQRLAQAAGITHGIGLFLVLLGGFGMMARLGIHCRGRAGYS